ncbi:SDR family oxidoreductase [Tundrisphaera sp. TA3]|uniref:SDR family oxidoreductase n=1 Tax=Tundrisphaera sp. TA3 TaxID=3435775 RepID=UPI003EB7740B
MTMRVLVTGASGQLGAYVIGPLRAEGHEVVGWSGSESARRDGLDLAPIDLRDPASIVRSLDEAAPDVVLHLAALSAAEAVRRDPETARAVNVEATRRIALWCADRGRRVVFTSTDLVFDGSRAWNREDDPTGPVLAYGCTKAEAEAAILGTSHGLVARVSLLYGPSRCGRPYFFDRAISALRAGTPQSFFADEHRTPLDLGTAGAILARLAGSAATGVIHVAGAERVSRFDLMRRAASALSIDPELVRPGLRADAPAAEPRPADVSLDTSRLSALFPDLARPTIEEALRGGASR